MEQITIEQKIYLSALEEEISAILMNNKEQNNIRTLIMEQSERLLKMSTQEIIKYYSQDRIGLELIKEYVNTKVKVVENLELYQNNANVREGLEIMLLQPSDGADRNYDINETLKMLIHIDESLKNESDIIIVNTHLWSVCVNVLHDTMDYYKDEYILVDDVSDTIEGKLVYLKKDYFNDLYARKIDYNHSNVLALYTHVGMIAQCLALKEIIHNEFEVEDISRLTTKFYVDFHIYNAVHLLNEGERIEKYGAYGYTYDHLEGFFTDLFKKHFPIEVAHKI